MPTLEGTEDTTETTAFLDRVRGVVGVVRSERYPWLFVIFTGGALLALANTPAPWIQVGLLSVLGMVIEYTRRGKIRP